MNEKPTEKVVKLPIITKFCMTIGELPTSYLMSLTYLEQVTWLCNFLEKTMIPALNQNGEAVKELQNLYELLRTYVNTSIEEFETSVNNKVQSLEDFMNNYFDNLDVQEEINNKLDDMLEDGVLTEIIQQFLQSTAIWCFDTVADMKLATNLINGSYAQTLGYYSIGDEGASLYKITNISSPTEHQETLSNGLYATLVLENDSVNVHQLGAKGDDLTDDSDNINKALSLNCTHINFGHNKRYKVRGYEEGQAEGSTTGLTATTGLVIPSNKIVDLNESEISCITNSRQNYNIFTIKEVENVILKNGKITGDRQTHAGTSGQWGYGVSIRYSNNITLENLYCSECWGDGININDNGDKTTLLKNININNCICDSNRRQGMSIENGDNIIITNCSFINTGNNNLYTAPSSGVDIEPMSGTAKNIKFDKCNFSDNRSAGIILDGENISNVSILNSNILNNNEQTSQSSISLLSSTNTLIENCNINNVNIDKSCTIQCWAKKEVLLKNNTCDNVRIFIRSNNMTDDFIRIIGNKITVNRDNQYNAVIETVNPSSETTNKNNTLIIENNLFYSPTQFNTQAWITCLYSAKFNKLICKNNIFKYGKHAIRTTVSNIIENNNFIAMYNHVIQLPTGNDNQVTNINSNIFEEPSYNINNNGIISNSNNNNIVLMNNTSFTNCISTDDQIERQYSPIRFLQNQNPTGSSLDFNNNILDNTII